MTFPPSEAVSETWRGGCHLRRGPRDLTLTRRRLSPLQTPPGPSCTEGSPPSLTFLRSDPPAATVAAAQGRGPHWGAGLWGDQEPRRVPLGPAARPTVRGRPVPGAPPSRASLCVTGTAQGRQQVSVTKWCGGAAQTRPVSRHCAPRPPSGHSCLTVGGRGSGSVTHQPVRNCHTPWFTARHPPGPRRTPCHVWGVVAPGSAAERARGDPASPGAPFPAAGTAWAAAWPPRGRARTECPRWALCFPVPVGNAVIPALNMAAVPRPPGWSILGAALPPFFPSLLFALQFGE